MRQKIKKFKLMKMNQFHGSRWGIAFMVPLHAGVLLSLASAQEELAPTVVTADSGLAVGEKVTAFKTDTPLIDVPQSVSVVTKERLEEQAIRTVADLTDYTPGLVNSQGEGHRDAVVFRGNRTTADFFVDGVRDDVEYYRGFYNIEQVEVLRGPNALFFGRGGTGGVINRVTKKPELGQDFGEIFTSLDTFGANYFQFDYNKAVSDDSAFRVNLFQETLNNHRDFYDGERYGINPTFLKELGPDTRILFSYEYSNYENFVDRGIPTGANGRPVQALADTTFADEELNESTLDAHTFKVALEHDFSERWKGRVSGFYGDYRKSYGNFFPSDFNEAANEVTIDGYIDRTDRATAVFSADVVGEFETWGIGHKVVFGGEYIYTSSDQDRFNSVFDTTGDDEEVFNADNFRLRNGSGINSNGVLATSTFSDLNDDTRVDIDAFSFFAQDEIALHRMFDLVLGVRFDSFDIEVFDAVNGETRTRRDQEVSPRLGAIFKPVEYVSFYGSYTESFLPRSGDQFSDINGSNDALDPNTFSNVEVGVKWDIRENLHLSLAAFQIEQSSPQVSDLDPGTLDVIDTRTNGIEAELQGRITDYWTLSVAYSYLDGEQISVTGADTGLDPREQPEHVISVWNHLQVTEKFGFGLGMVYQDESFADNANTAILPSFVRFDAAAYYQFTPNFSMQLNIRNLFDRDIFPSAHTADNVTVGAPINATLAAKLRF